MKLPARVRLAAACMCRFAAVGGVATLVAAIGTHTALAQSELSATLSPSAPARILPAPPPPPEEEMEEDPQDDTPLPTRQSISAVPPQYRVQQARGVQFDAANAAIRFVVPLTGQPLLIEARINIDAEPYRQRREHRIDAILADLQPPAPPKPQQEFKSELDEVIDGAPDTATDAAEPEPAPADSDTPAEEVEDEAEESEAPAPPAPDNSIGGRLQRYVNATQRIPSREEIRSFLQKWTDGPVLLLLNENFQRIRGRQTPVFRILDRDEDGIVSADELKNAYPTLLRYDRNGDEILTYEEIAVGAERTPIDPTAPSLPPLIPLADIMGLRNPEALLALDQDGNGVFDKDDVAKLATATPDLQLTVSFDTVDQSKSKIDFVSGPESVTPVVRAESVTLPLTNALLEVSAVVAEVDAESDQISIGAVRDGYPILPALDLDNDGRLSIREMRQVGPQLAGFDSNNDGAISLDEIPGTFRVSFGLGATVHEHLTTVRSIHPPPIGPKVEPPGWFVRSDGNQDGDLTPKEFLGNRDQFAMMDTDDDGLISALEAVASEEKKESSEPTDNVKETES